MIRKNEGQGGPISVPAGSVILDGNLAIPPGATGLVVCLHGSGSGRYSPRNRYLANELQEAGLATLLIDLLTLDEEQADRITAEYRFNVHLLAERVIGVTEWLQQDPETRDFTYGYFGASTGAAAALLAAAEHPDGVRAVACRGGRPDLAWEMLEQVWSPTLFIVGGDDGLVLRLNEEAVEIMRAETQLEVVAGATHLFEEAGALEQVAELARDWFERYL